MPTTVTVRVNFEAAHRLHNPDQSAEWNRETYGKCNNPHGHGHNYVLEVTVEGPVDPTIGYLIDMKILKDILRYRIIDEVDHRFLNIEVPWLEGVIPSAENLARAFFDRVAGRLPEGVVLSRVTVHETERNSASYWAG
ncbi:MAG: 6-carboxytetrahydropterin synthase [Thermoanaerobaculales bacterium]|nr:6-carboxytetrahydropterin synthase [Thermoanaerobaculales bacterium]